MTDQATHDQVHALRRRRVLPRIATLWAMAFGLVVLICASVMEGRFAGLSVEDTTLADTPVTLYRAPGTNPLPPVIVSHGFAGSRQMMDQIAVSLARAGFLVASVDLPGHGRNPAALSPDVTNLAGTTAALVANLNAVADAVAARSDAQGPVSFVGHSMSSDLVIRAAKSREDVGGVVAISMYSPAVTATEPRALLVLSGGYEGRLRAAGLEALRLIDPDASENETITSGETLRRAAAAPFVGHVGVLYSGTSLREITGWLGGSGTEVDRSGWVAGGLLASLLLLFWPLSKFIPKRAEVAHAPLPANVFAACLIVPLPVVALLGMAPIMGFAGLTGFGSLCAILGLWGAVQLGLLWRAGVRPARPDWTGTAMYLGAGLLFALALDRYGAAFVPTGTRAWLLPMLLIGTLPLMAADTLLAHRAGALRRALLRLSLIAGLATAMFMAPTELGLTFTVLPVLVLFFVVYGSLARWVAGRRGPAAVALGKGVALAWAIAASTPLFAVS